MLKFSELIRRPSNQAILACLTICVVAFGFRWMVYQTAPLDFLLEGDTRRIMTSGTMFNANILRACRDTFGEEATCGMQTADDSEVATYYEWTHFNDYIEGEASYDTVIATGKRGLGPEDANWVYPIEALLDLPNLKGWEVGLILWIVGPDTESVVLIHILLMVLTTACVFGMGYFMGNLRAAIFASLIWTFHPSAVSNFMFGRQQIGAAFFFTFGSLCLILAFRYQIKPQRIKPVHWLILSITSFWVFSLYIYLFRPFLIVLILLVLFYLWRRADFKRMALTLAVWSGLILLLSLALWPIRTAYLTEDPTLGEHLQDVVMGTRSTEGDIGSVYAYDNSKPILWLPPAPDDPFGKFLRDFSGDPVYYIQHNILGIYRGWEKPAFPGYHVDDFNPHRSADAAAKIGDRFPYLDRSTEALAYHRISLMIALVGFIWLIGSEQRPVVMILGLTILLISSLHALFHNEDRYLFPQLPVMLVFSGLWLDRLLRLPRLRLGMLGLVTLLLLGSLALSVADLGFLLDSFAPRTVFILLWAVRIILLSGVVVLSARWLLGGLSKYAMGLMGSATVVLSGILLVGAAYSHWSDWSQEMQPNETVRQTMTLSSIPYGQIPWLVVDIPRIRYPEEQNAFAIAVDGQVVKNYDDPMYPWFAAPVWAEGRWLVRYWLAIPLDASMLPSGQPINVDITTQAGWTMNGDFIVGNSGKFYGPSLGVDGETHKLGYLSYDDEFEYEPRIYKYNDLGGIQYASSWQDADGNWHTDDLSRADGRQTGRYRIYLIWQNPGVIVPEPITELPHP